MVSTSPAQPSLDDAFKLYRQGKSDLALAEYNSIIAANPNSAQAFTGLSRVLLRLKRIDDSYAAAAKAVQLLPDLSDAHVALGEVYFRQGKLTDAENEFLTQVRANSSNARAFLGMARISEAASFHKQAKDMIDRSYALDPHDPDVNRERLRILGRSVLVHVQSDSKPGESNDSSSEGTLMDRLVTFLGDTPIPDGPSCKLVSNTKSAQVELLPMHESPSIIRGYGLNVKIDGASSVLALDTGAPGILVNHKIAEKAKLKKIGQTTISGIGDKGPIEGYIGVADSIKIGDLEFQGCVVEVSEKGTGVGVDGLIGTDLFSQFLVDIDFPKAKLKLSELPPYPNNPAPASGTESDNRADLQLHNRYVASEMKTYTPVYIFRKQILVRTKINDSITKLFVLDTGSVLNLISPAAAREVTKVSRDSQMELRGLSGNVKDVFSADSVTLTFGNLRQKNLDISAFDPSALSESLGTEVSGFLGFAVLRMLDVKIDYRDGLVNFDFDSKRFF
ncbi:MAG TPA: aspartyl protease family protein [Candidatus Acidoferrales bacterium]|nr:aspartyl protease family protein [Candidatus Acidoferrales bacterium]